MTWRTWICRHTKKTLSNAYTKVQQNVSSKQEHEEEFYDKWVHGAPHKPRDLVWLHNPSVLKGRVRKFHCSWIGSYLVLEKLSVQAQKRSQPQDHSCTLWSAQTVRKEHLFPTQQYLCCWATGELNESITTYRFWIAVTGRWWRGPAHHPSLSLPESPASWETQTLYCALNPGRIIFRRGGGVMYHGQYVAVAHAQHTC